MFLKRSLVLHILFSFCSSKNPWKKNYDQPRQHIKKQTHYTANKGLSMVSPVVMYECESWTIKKAEHGRIDAFKLWCWKRLFSPLDCKEIKLVNPKGNRS